MTRRRGRVGHLDGIANDDEKLAEALGRLENDLRGLAQSCHYMANHSRNLGRLAGEDWLAEVYSRVASASGKLLEAGRIVAKRLEEDFVLEAHET